VGDYDPSNPNFEVENPNSVAYGAKYNWKDGIYQTNGTLKVGKEKWCAGCHDNVPSVVETKTATDIVGDNTTYGYYLDAHGNATYGVKRIDVSYPQGECLHCHDVSKARVTPLIDESFEGTGYEETWTEPAGNPDEDYLHSAIPGTPTPPTGAGSQCLQSISADPGYEAYAKTAYGSEQPKTFTRFYLYVDNVGLNNNENKKIGDLQDSYGNNVFAFRLDKDSSGQLRFNLRLVYKNGSSYYDDYFNISSGTSAKWYRIEVKYDNTTGNAYCEWRVDGVSQGSWTLTTATQHYTGIQKWIFGFETSTIIKTGTIYFDLVKVRNDDWVGEEQLTGMPLHGGKLFDTTDNFCFKCHDNTTTFATTAIVNRSYSYRAGGWTSDSLDDILEAFSYPSPGSSHKLSSIKTFINGKWGYDTGSNPCAACHNPHSVQGDPANSPDATKSPSTRGYMVSRPSEHTTNYNNIWGDETGERMKDYADPKIYQAPCQYPRSSTCSYGPPTSCEPCEPDGSATKNGSNVFDSVTFCLDCHKEAIGTVSAIDWSTNGDIHGKATQVGGYQCRCADMRAPYPGNPDPAIYPNRVLSCLDCHEPHGSPNEYLLRQEVNGFQVNVLNGGPISGSKWFNFCQSCHKNLGVNHTPSINSNNDCWGCHFHGNTYPCDGYVLCDCYPLNNVTIKTF